MKPRKRGGVEKMELVVRDLIERVSFTKLILHYDRATYTDAFFITKEEIASLFDRKVLDFRVYGFGVDVVLEIFVEKDK